MPNIVLPIDDVQDSVERPVIFDIIRQVMEITKISHKTNIMFLGDEGRAAQLNSTITKNTIEENRWHYNEKVSIEVDEDFDRNRLINTVVNRPDNLYIFHDAKLPVFIRPVYSGSEVKITIKYKARDKNQANRWRNDLRTRIAMMRDINLHEINYHYCLPEKCIDIIKGIHTLRETIAPYGESFDEYFVNHLTTNASVITNLSGTAAVWGISERQIRVQGYFDFEGAPEKGDKEGDQDNWAISLVYTFKYDKPIECNMVYPIMVHNQLLSEDFRSSEVAYRIEDQPRSYTASGRAFAEFESDKYSISSKGNVGVSIPHFDEFYPETIIPTTVRVLTAITNIVPENKTTLFNLRELGDLSLDPVILDFIANSEYAFMGKAYRSIFCLSLYRETSLNNDDSLVIDSNLNVSSTKELDLRQTYRVRLSLVTDMSYLTMEALTRLRKYPLVAVKLIKAINSALRHISGHADINKNILSDEDMIIMTGINKTNAVMPLLPTFGNNCKLVDSGKWDNNLVSWGDIDDTWNVPECELYYKSLMDLFDKNNIKINLDADNMLFSNSKFGRGDRILRTSSLYVQANKSLNN